MKVEYIDPFVQAACGVLEQITGVPARKGTPGLLGTTYPTASINIATRISGSLSGDLVYSMSSPTAGKLAELLTGRQIQGFGRLTAGGLNRLADMLTEQTGRRLSERGFDCEISSPTVFRGLSVEFASSAPALMVPLETEAGQIDINVAVKDGKQS